MKRKKNEETNEKQSLEESATEQDSKKDPKDTYVNDPDMVIPNVEATDTENAGDTFAEENVETADETTAEFVEPAPAVDETIPEADGQEADRQEADTDNTSASQKEDFTEEANSLTEDVESPAEETLTEKDTDAISAQTELPQVSPSEEWDEDEPIPMTLGAHEIHSIIDSEDPDAPILQETSTKRTDATLTSKGKKVNWKPRMFLVVMAVISVIVLVWSVISLGNLTERLASPLTVGNQDVSNAEFSFMYHYVLLENGVDIFKEKTEEMLSGPGENGFATYREYFLDSTAKEIQTVYMLYDDAIAHGYSIEQDHIDRAKAYVDWLKGKADAIHVDLDTYIKGSFGPYVSKDLIMQVLPKVYFTEDYAGHEKLDELKATEEQAEKAYQDGRNSYDLVSFRMIRINFEAREQSYVDTANIRAQQIIDEINHDQSKFESAAAKHFSGEMKQRLLVPDSTLHRRTRYSEVEDMEWRNWLFDTRRTSGDCVIFKDDYGFPILFCFVERVRQDEPLRNVRFFYINMEMEDSDVPGIPKADIIPLSQTIFDSITDEASMITLETTYADELLEGSMRAVQQTALYPGNNSAQIDEWVFDPDRKSGDKILFEEETQILILFYVESSPNPEWYDRVNSFIRMDNYQAFVSEKLKDYPYKFHKKGLEHVQDIPS